MRNDIENPPPFLHNCPGINPFTLDEAALARLDEQLNDKRCVGIKIYAGY
jgi:hypothetical protein